MEFASCHVGKHVQHHPLHLYIRLSPSDGFILCRLGHFYPEEGREVLNEGLYLGVYGQNCLARSFQYVLREFIPEPKHSLYDL